MNINRLRYILGIFFNRGGSRFWDYKSVFILLLGYVIGNLISEFYDYNSVKIIPKTLNHQIDIGQHNHSIDPKAKASKLYNNVKILCWVMTQPKNHKTRASQILNTWGKRCNKILLMSSAADKELHEIVPLPVGEGRDNLWAKTKEAFTYIYDFHFDEYDWFLKADDDTYVIVENLRLLLYEYDSRTPIYFGFKFSAYVEQGYMSGGAGYVLSKEALRRFVEIAIPDLKLCRADGAGSENAEIGICLENVGVIAGDSRDYDKRGRFFVFRPEHHLLTYAKNSYDWYWQYMYYKAEEGLRGCSNYAISFHYINGKEMYILDYLIYHVKPYGIVDTRKLPSKKKQINRKISK